MYLKNFEKNKKFLELIDENTKNTILESIASNYQVSKEKIYDEVTNENAEHLTEYMTEEKRTATYIMMGNLNCI